MPHRQVGGKQVTVIGAARSGVAAAGLLGRQGARVFVTDARTPGDETAAKLDAAGASYEFGGHTGRAREADFFVISPGVPDHAPFVRSLIEEGQPIYSEVEVASWFCDAPIAAITGTNGKTTTTALLAHALRTGGRSVTVAGNIGAPFADVADGVDRHSVVVLEVSSFQLDHIDTFRPHVSILLNITPDHLDRYSNDFGLYAAAKFRVFQNQASGDALIYNRDDAVVRSRVERDIPAGVIPLAISTEHAVDRGAFIKEGNIILRPNHDEERLMPHEELSLRGRHNLYNSLAASMAARFLEVSNDLLRESMQSFEGVPNRLELVREVHGVHYVNDSKATNVNAVWYALESFDEPIVWIAGGQDKGNDYSEIQELVQQKVAALITMGTAAETIEEALGGLLPVVRRAGSMDEAVGLAHQIAQRGQIVLLSPACASFDMFDDYEHRGEAFRRAVRRL